MANKLFPTDYNKDESCSESAGYPIYRGTVEYYDYICDLGDKLELNLKDGNKTVNIWIVEGKKEEETAEELSGREEDRIARLKCFRSNASEKHLSEYYAKYLLRVYDQYEVQGKSFNEITKLYAPTVIKFETNRY